MLASDNKLFLSGITSQYGMELYVGVAEGESVKFAKSKTANEKTSVLNAVLFPNPATDVLNVKIESANTSKMNVVVTDFSKRIWITKAVQLSQGANNVQFAIRNLPAGTYFLKIISTDGSENAMMKFVKP